MKNSAEKCFVCDKPFIDNNVAYVLSKVVVDANGHTKDMTKMKTYHEWCWKEIAGDEYSF